MPVYIVPLETEEYTLDRDVVAQHCPIVRACGNCWIALCDREGAEALEEAAKRPLLKFTVG